MRKIYLVFLVLLLSMLRVNAQTEVQVGTGTSTQAYPFGANWGFDRSASVYTPTELTLSGNISTLAWQSTTTVVNRPIKIYLKEANLATFASSTTWQSLITGATLVYDGSSPILTGWNSFFLTNDFNYTGTNNLLVLIETNFGGTGGGSSTSMTYSTSTSKHASARADTNPPTNVTSNNNRPNVKITFGPRVTCFAPTNVNFSNLTTNSVTINWEAFANATSGYIYEIRTDTNPGTSGAISTGSVETGVITANITGLTPNTAYNLYIRSNCSDSDLSPWGIVKSFRTLCLPVSNLPYFENFDSSTLYPYCWSKYPVNTPNIYTSTSNSSAPNSLLFKQDPTSQPVFAITPIFTSPIETLRVRFKLRRENATYSGNFTVGVLMDTDDEASFIPVREFLNTEILTDWDTHVINFNEVPEIVGSGKQIAFRQTNATSTIYYFWIDDVIVEQIPNCADVSGLATSNPTSSSIEITLTAPNVNPTNGYAYEVRSSGLPGSGTEGLVKQGTIPANTFNYVITGLPDNSTLKVYLKSDCGSGTISYWSNGVDFRTNLIPRTLPFTENFDSTNPYFVLVNGTQTNKWVINNLVSTSSDKALYITNNTTTKPNTYSTSSQSIVYAYTDINIPSDIASYQLSFDLKSNGQINYDDLSVWMIPATTNLTAGTNITESSTNILLGRYFGLTQTTNVNIDLDNRFTSLIGQTGRLVLYWRNDSSGGEQPPAYLDNLEVKVKTCLAPTTTFTVTSNSETTAILTLPNDFNGEYEYEIRTNTYPGGGSATQLILNGTINTATNRIINLTPLVARTNYYVFLRKKCSSNNYSPWVYKTFTTNCTPIAAPTAVENFEAYTGSISATSLPCWNEAVKTGNYLIYNTSTWNTATNNSTKVAQVALTGTKNDWLISPIINLSASAAPLRLVFKASTILPAGTNSLPADKSVKVLISTDGGNSWNENTPLKVFTGNEIPGSGFTNEEIDLSAYTGNVRFAFVATSTETTSGLSFNIDDFKVDTYPICRDIPSVQYNNLTKNSVKVQWTAPSLIPSVGYQILVFNATETNLIDTNVAIPIINVPNTDLEKVVTGLSISTAYKIFVRTNCGSGEVGAPSLILSFTTFCDYPDFTSVTPATRCGIGTTILTAAAATGSVSWFKNQTGGSPLATTNSFTTPEIRETTSYWVQSQQVAPNIRTQVGNGTTETTSTLGANPFYSNYGGIKSQYIFTAEELLSAGVEPGPINSLGFEVIGLGTNSSRRDFTIKVGHTDLTVAPTTNNFVENLATVFVGQEANNGYTLTQSGVTMFNFTEDFIWDGQQSIAVQVVWNIGNSSGISGSSVRTHIASANRTTRLAVDNLAVASTSYLINFNNGTWSPPTTGSGTPSRANTTIRPNTYFNGNGICTSPRTEVIATVTPPPALVLSHEGITLCAGENQLVTVTEGLANYDNYVWTPNTGITGSASTGWTFAPTANTNYTLRASQNSGSCVTEVKLNVTVNPLPEFTPIAESFTICADEAQLLDSRYITEKTVTIGEGRTTTTQDTFSDPSAFMNRYDQTKQQIIYTKEDLNNLGIYSGEINELAFEISSLGSSANNANYTIKMKPITESYFINNTFSTENFITVFGPINYTHTASGWQNFVLTTPYTWDGISNILIELTHDGANSINNAETYYTETQENTVILTMGNSGITANAAYTSKKRLNLRLKTIMPGVISWTPSTNLYLDASATQPYAGEDVKKVYVKGTENSSTTYTFTMVTNKGCTATDSTTVNIINVTEPVVASQTICEPEVTNIVISGQDQGGVFKWYATEEGTEAITSITETGTYYVEQVLGTCKSDRVSAVITYNPTLPAPTAENQLFCEVTNLATVADLQVIEATGTIGWFLTEDSETPLATTTELVTGTYYVAQFNGNCWSPKTAVEIESGIIPIAPTGGSQSFCGALSLSEIPLAVVPGGVINWYDTETSTERLPLTSIISNRNYYISQSIGSCESPRVLLQIAVIPTLPAPTAPTGVLYCNAITFDELDVNLDIIGTKGWFTSLNLTEPNLDLSSQVTTGTYYVAQFNGACWSPKTKVIVTVNTTPAALNNRTQQLCGVFTLADANLGQAAGAIVNFYASESSSDLLPLNTPLVTGTYYVSQQLGGCESPKVAVNFEVAEILIAPQTQPNQLYCGPTTVADLNATPSQNGIIGWFTSLTSNTPLNNTSPVQTGVYYVAQRNAHCWSEKVRVQVTVNPIPSNLNNTTQLLCGTYRFENISVGATSGSTVNWYAADGTTRLPSNSVAESGNYFISQTINNCESSRLPINLTVTGVLNKPIASTQTICGSGTVSNLVAEGNPGATIVWYTSQTSNIPLANNSPLTTGTYYVAQTMNGCYSERRAVAVRVVSTTAPQVNPFMICGSGTVADLIIPAATGVTYKWYNSPNSTNELAQNTPLTTGTYFVERNHYGCISARTAVQVTIGNIPNAPTGSTTQTFIEGSTIANLGINETNVVWYATYNDSQNGTNPLALNMPLVNGQTYYAVIIGTNGCPSLPLAVTVDVYLSKDEFAKSELKYYPNPVIDILNLSYSETITQIEIFDLLGKRIKTFNTNDNNVELDLSDLATGTYMLQLKSENKEQYIKIVKK